jgi:hypothetical protein
MHKDTEGDAGKWLCGAWICIKWAGVLLLLIISKTRMVVPLYDEGCHIVQPERR